MNSWELTYNDWKPEEEGLREALHTLGNGWFATRGAAEESDADDVHYPGTYLAGCYNRLKSEVQGRIVENEDIVNWPNWLCLSFRIKNGKWFSLRNSEVLDFCQKLDLKKGILIRSIKFKDEKGNITSLFSRRLVSMKDKHAATIQWKLTPENWSGPIEVLSGINGNVTNNNVPRYAALNNKHLEIIDKGSAGEEGIFLKVHTNQSNLQMAQAVRTRFYKENIQITPPSELVEKDSYIAQKFKVTCSKGQELLVEKVAVIYSSRDWAISEVALEAKKEIARMGGFYDLYTQQKQTWEKLWDRCDIEIEGDQEAQMILRFHIFHLLQIASLNTTDNDAGIPARGLHGEGYRGHIFWDDLYIFPYLNLRLPEITRELMMYRYRRLREANIIAKENGCRGACFPWQSGSNGREETAELLFNPMSGNWYEDHTFRQRHINAAIVFNIWQYYQTSADREFMIYHGTRIIVEIALFWSDLATYNENLGRYEIKGVVGPDEYHTKYPWEENYGLNNNAYTNVMVSWALQKAIDALNILTNDKRLELLDSLEISQQDIKRWDEISRKLYIPFYNQTIINQFDDYDKLQELNLEDYRKKYGNHLRVDLIKEAEGDSVENYRISKQADVLMLFYIFSPQELKQLFEHMSYEFTPKIISENIEFYDKRTSNGSSLSRLVRSWLMARYNRHNSWEYFKAALREDISDTQGGTTREGVHLGAMAGTVDLIQRGYTGMEFKDDVLWFNPALPENIKKIRMRLCYRGHWFILELRHKKLDIRFEESYKGEIKIGFRGVVYSSEHKRSLSFHL